MKQRESPPVPVAVLIILLASLASAAGIYILLTYLVPAPKTADPDALKPFIIGLQFLGALAFVVGLAFLRLRLEKDKGPAPTMRTVIVSAAIGDTIGVFGLLEYFLTGYRNWLMFGACLGYFAIMFLALPTILRAFNEN